MTTTDPAPAEARDPQQDPVAAAEAAAADAQQEADQAFDHARELRENTALEPAQAVSGQLVTAPVGSVVADLAVIPPDQEMRGLAQLANTLAMANVVPAALRHKPNDVFAVLLTARDTGVALTVALREFHVIEGRVTLSPKVKLAMVRRAGLGRIWPAGDNDAESATWYATRADMPEHVVESSFTWADAQRAGLVDTRCTPTTHWKPERQTQGGGGRGSGGNAEQRCMCKDNWKRYPQRMLSWRSAGYLLDDVFPDVGTGLYSPDELGAVTDEDGQPIDVTAVEGLPGMKGGRSSRGAASAPPEDPPATDEDRAEIKSRIEKLSDDARKAFGRWWAEQELPKVDELLARNVKKVSSRLDWQERQPGAKREDAGDDATTPGDDAPAPTGGETPGEPETGQEDPLRPVEPIAPLDWLIAVARAAEPGALRAEFRADGMRPPTGNEDVVRRTWCEWRLPRVAAALFAAVQATLTGSAWAEEDDVAEAYAELAG